MQSANLHQQELPVTVYQQWEISTSIKPAIKWLLWVIAIVGIVGFVFTGVTNLVVHSAGRYMFLLVFLLMGIQHVFILSKWLPHLQQGRKFIYTLLLVFLMVPLLYVLFSMQSYFVSRLPIVAGVVFTMPFLCQYCWYYFAGTKVEYLPFFIQDNVQPETKMSLLLLNSIPFTVQIIAKQTDRIYTQIPVIVNPRLNMDIVFSRFFYHQQERIENSTQTGWRFFMKKWYGLKPLNPYKSLAENNIQPEDIVIAERYVLKNTYRATA